MTIGGIQSNWKDHVLTTIIFTQKLSKLLKIIQISRDFFRQLKSIGHQLKTIFITTISDNYIRQ